MLPKFVLSDGGRSAAGFEGDADDCCIRSIVHATGQNYKKVQRALLGIATEWHARANGANAKKEDPDPLKGVASEVAMIYMDTIGWEQVVFNRRLDEMPRSVKTAVLFVRNEHMAALRDGKYMDSYDSRFTAPRTANGVYCPRKPRIITRYWVKPTAGRRR